MVLGSRPVAVNDVTACQISKKSIQQIRKKIDSRHRPMSISLKDSSLPT